MDTGFGYWLAGFLDGEGHFGVRRKGISAFTCCVTVNLRRDDEPLLHEIVAQTGLGVVYDQNAPPQGHPQVRWDVAKKPEVVALCDILDAHPLRSKKARDFAIWREAVGVWATVSRGGAPSGRADRNAAAYRRLAELSDRLRGVRAYDETPVVH